MSDLLQDLGYLATASRFRRISERLYQDGDKVYAEAGIAFKASWFSVFYVLANAEASVSILEIARKIETSHVAVKNVLKELSERNFIEISQNPNDKRSKNVALSKEGKKLLRKMKPLWSDFSIALNEILDSGHPDFIRMLDRIDYSSLKKPLNQRLNSTASDKINILDYRPDFKSDFFRLLNPWLLEVLDGTLEEEDEYSLNNPEEAYLSKGGFIFFAQADQKLVATIVLKRLDADRFEIAKLYIRESHRQRGIATQLVNRCISRAMENAAKEIWLQSTMSMPQAHQLYYKLGFEDGEAPASMLVLNRTEKIMYLSL